MGVVNWVDALKWDRLEVKPVLGRILQITGPTGTTVSREIMSGRTDRCKTGRQQGERCW